MRRILSTTSASLAASAAVAMPHTSSSKLTVTATPLRTVSVSSYTQGGDHNMSSKSFVNPADATAAVAEAFDPSTSKVADFGSVKRREQRRREREVRNKAAMDALSYMQRVISRPSPTEELDAQSALRDLGFTTKPPSCLYHRQFLSELRRYRLDLTVSNVNATVQELNLTDYGLDGKGEEVKVCDNLRTVGDGENNLVSDLHEAISNVVFATGPTTFKVKLANEYLVGHELIFKSVFPLGTSGSSSASSSTEEMSAEDKAAAEAERLLNESLKIPFEPVPGGPYRRYIQRVDVSIKNLQNGHKRDLINNISVQALTYMFIMSISRFLKSTKAHKNCPFDAENVGYLRYCIVNLRQQIGMEAIGEFELDTMLPKPDE